MDYFIIIDAIRELWPEKKHYELESEKLKAVLVKHVKTEDDLQRVKDAIEVKIEDSPNRLPDLAAFIEKLFAPVLVKRETIQPSRPVEVAAVKNIPTEASVDFDVIWESWPTHLYLTESRSKALAAFCQLLKVETLENIKLACNAYSGAFATMPEGTNINPLFLRTFLGDREVFDDWLGRSKKQGCFGEFDKQQFEAAYSHYPNFRGKDLSKTKSNALSAWYRSVPKEERLDFLITCKAYEEERYRDVCEQNISDEEGMVFTKNFNTFLGEWREYFDGFDLKDIKRDFIGNDLLKIALDNDLDLTNIYGEHDDNFCLTKALPFYIQKHLMIRPAVEGLLKNCSNTINLRKNNWPPVKDIGLAEKQLENLDIVGLTNKIMDELIIKKSIIKPVRRA